MPTVSVWPMTSTSGTGRFAISANTLSKSRFELSVNSSLPSTKYSVNCAGAAGRAASAAPNCDCTSAALEVAGFGPPLVSCAAA